MYYESNVTCNTEKNNFGSKSMHIITYAIEENLLIWLEIATKD